MTPQEFTERAEGHADTAINEAAIALWRAYCRADLGNRRTLMVKLINRTTEYATEVENWRGDDLLALMKTINR